MANEKYLLEVARIDETIDIFKGNHTGYDSIIVENKDKKKVVTIHKKKEKGVLNIFFLTGGTVSFQIQSKLTSDCGKLKEFIIKQCEIPFPDVKQYEAKDVDLNQFDLFIEFLKDYDDFEISTIHTNESSERNRIKIKNQSEAVVTITCYTTRTVTLQGKLTPLFVQIFGLMSEYVAGGSFDKEFKLLNSTQNATPNEIKIEDYVSNIGLLSKKYKTLIESSIKLANGAIIIEDNSGLITSMMKAIEGLMIDKISTKIDPRKSFDYFTRSGDKYLFKPEYDYFPDAENSILEESYTFWNKYRHPYSHIEKLDTINTRLLSYDKALDIITKGLKITDKLLTLQK